jgi:probable rRNA maturation factor
MPITFHAANIKLPLIKKAAIKKFISERALKESGKKLSLIYVFCSDDFLLDMNRQFLDHDYYTDIITFPLAETERGIEAEIYISVDRVKDNAGKFETNFADELNRVVFHGVLHLIGYKDKSKADKEMMRNKENEWLNAFKRAVKNKL